MILQPPKKSPLASTTNDGLMSSTDKKKLDDISTNLNAHIDDSVKHITNTERTNWNAAKTHADSAHAPSNAQANVIETVKVNGTALTPSSKAVNVTVPTKVSELTDSSDYVKTTDSRLTDARTPKAHNQASNTINAMTGYSKPSSTSAITTSDSLNTAIGKLEKALDSKQTSGSYAASNHTHDDRYYTESEINTKLNTKLNTSLKGAASGLAELDSSGKVPSSQLPSYVDDVLEYANQSSFPVTGESGKIYIAQDTNKTYRWSGSTYVEISPSLALGETSATAYRGDRGKVAYDHSQTAHAPSNAQANVIETIKVNGTALTPSSKAVNITVPTNNNQLTNGAGYITSSGTAKTISDTLPISKGGTGKTTGEDAANALINSLSTGGDGTPTDNDYFISQQINGGTTYTSYFRRPVSKLWEYIKSKLATVATSGSYNDLSNKPTIPSVGNGTITIKQAGTTKGTFTTNQSGNTTIELTDSDINTWRPLGTTADTACAGNDARLSNARPASDVYAWAKASSKPSYTWNEITNKPSTFTPSSHTHSYAGASSSGGSATSAVKLDSSAGSATQPVYFSGGKPVACSYTLGKSVPSNAVFTDTTYPVYFKYIERNYTTAYRTQAKGNSSEGGFITALRCSAESISGAPQHGSGIGWGLADTHGYLYVNYSTAEAYIGGGNKDQLNWVKSISLNGHTHNYAGSSSAGGAATTALKCTGNSATSSKLTSSSYTTISIATSDWATNSSGGYVCTKSLSSAMAYTNFNIDVVLSTDQSAAKLQIESWNNVIADGEITQTTSNGSTTAFTFYAFTTKPSVALTVGIQGVS